ncbi:MAG: zinc-binding dehydrogenase [Candidatus Hydrogenedens sp.]|nr:zinc-binding dehydrogenase [Candidatus Hydrogenedens sp.]
MRAVYIEANGGIEQLRTGDLPKPQPGPGEVLVAVRAAALNHLDIWIRKGRPGLTLSFPHVLGSDAAGTIAETGPGVSQVQVGDEVVINPGISCMRCEWCLRGEQSECASFGILGAARQGAFAEYVVVPEVNVQSRPAHLSWEEAAALPLAHLTAWRMLFSRGQLRSGETVLIHGIGGGVAIAGLQLATAAGASVIVTSSSEDKLQRAAELGAAQGINYASANVAERVAELTGGRGVDLVLDTVGASTWPLNFQVARKGGRIVHCGVTAGATVEANISALYARHLTVMGSTMGSQEDFRRLLRFVGSTGLRPVVDSAVPLEEAVAQQTRMEQGGQFGKLVLTV